MELYSYMISSTHSFAIANCEMILVPANTENSVKRLFGLYIYLIYICLGFCEIYLENFPSDFGESAFIRNSIERGG